MTGSSYNPYRLSAIKGYQRKQARKLEERKRGGSVVILLKMSILIRQYRLSHTQSTLGVCVFLYDVTMLKKIVAVLMLIIILHFRS